MTEGVVKFAVDKLESMAAQELKLQTEVGKKVLDLRHELEWLRTFLRDADRKRRRQQPSSSSSAAAAAYDDLIEVWVRQTRELAHDAEDLLEEFVHRGELHCHGCFDVPSFLRWLRHSAAGVFARHAIFDGIEDIHKRIEQMKQQRKECNLEKLPCASKPHRKKYTDWSSLTELEIEDNLVKIGDYDEIERLVLDQSRQRTVINLTGKSGIGKTTLASYLYRKNSIRKHFTCTAWVHVPHKFRFVDLLDDVICQANASSADGEEEEDELAAAANMRRGGVEAERLVKERLAGALHGKRYLVVLDDVRSKEEWAFFLAALPGGLAGSCVLVTTQVKISEESEQSVAGGGLRTRELGKLRPEQAAKLFCRRLYGHGKEDPKKMAQLMGLVGSMTKGSNLPLNIVMLAGLLRSKKEDEWEAVIHSLDDTPLTSPEQTPPEAEPKKNDIVPAGETAVQPPPPPPTSTEQTKKKKKKQMATSMEKILTVCMDDLPSHLKPCFFYFAGFTAQTPICAGKIVRLWVAEGFLQAKNGQTIEEHGEECLKELISRCLVQLVETDAAGKVAAVSVHQAVLDFAQAEARDTNFLHVHSGAAGLSNGAARRLALRNTYDTDLTVMLEAPKLHTLLCDIPERAAGDVAVWQRALEFINGRAPTFSVHGSRFLRVMDLKGVRLPHRQTLPEEIGWLIHLRYLGLSHTAMKHLPSSVKRLRNLQTLDVAHTDVEALPWRFWRNPALRHVMARRLAAWSAPDERAVLPDLQTLHGVAWGRWARSGGGGGGAAIGKMTSLRSLMAWNVSAATAGEQLSSALAGLECLRSLDLKAADDAVTTLPLWDILAMLGLRQLEYLTLRGKVAPTTPPPPPLQAGHRHHHHYLLPNLAKLELHRSECDQSLIDILAKLPNLTELVLDEASYVKPYMKFPAGGFPKLRKMQLTSLDKLTECTVAPAAGEGGDGSQGGALPQLQHVSVFHCGKLNRFPVKLPKLDLLTIHDSEELKRFMDNEDNKQIHVVHGKMSKRRVTASKER